MSTQNSVLAKMAVVIGAQTSEFLGKMNQAERRFNTFGKNVNNVAASLGIVLGAREIYAGMAYAIGVAADFEHTMSEVKAITGATGEEFDKLHKNALKLGASTKFTSKEVGQLQIAYGRLGFTTKEILNATKATLDLSAATGEDLAKSADVAGSTVRGFGLEASETQRVVDVMAASFNQSALGLENFTESMKYVAPIAKAAGVSVEETTALLATLADAGIRGSMAGTSLRKIFTDLPKDGRPLQERLKELAAKGITLSDAMDEVGRTAQTSLLILTENTNKTDRLAASFQNVQGEAAKMARIMQNDLTGEVEKFSSAWEGMVLKVTNTNWVRSGVQGLTHLVNALTGTTDIDAELHQLASAIKQGIPNLDGFIKKMAEVRREAGEPIDTSASSIEFLAEKYNLSSEQANKLYQSILKANEALSFQERAIKQFKDFSERNGYTDLSKAADDYKERLYQLILQEQIHAAELQKFADMGGDFAEAYNPSIQKSKEQVSAYRRIISILNEYADTLPKVTKAQEEVNRTAPPKWGGMGSNVTDSLTPFNDRQVSMVEPWKLIDAAGEKFQDQQLENTKNALQAYQDKLYETASVAEEVGSILGSALGEGLNGQQSFVASLGQITGKIIQLYLRQSIAAMIAASIKDPTKPLPIMKIAGAAAGMAAISALFSRIGGSGGGGGSSASINRASSRDETRGSLNSEGREIKVSVEGVIEGDNIRWILNRNTQLNSRRR